MKEYWQSKKVMVTGGAGFIGSELSRQLAQNGAQVLAVDNLVSGHRENVRDVAGDFQLIETDICRYNEMHELLQGVDTVFHLACLGVRHSIHSPIENHRVNAEATLHLLKLSREAGVRRFVYVSSSEIYGTAQHVPMDEAHAPFPHTVYGASKLAGECYTRAYHDTYGFETVVIRPFNAYGPRCHHEGDSGEVIPKFMLRALCDKPLIIFGDGTQTRDFTFVSDTARGILTAGQCEAAIGETINLGSGFEISVNALAREIGHVIGRDVDITHDHPRPGDVLRLFSDSGKAERLLGFKPKITLREGLESLKGWYLSLGKRPEEMLAEEVVYNWQSKSGG